MQEDGYLGGPPGGKPLEVRIGFNLVNLTGINEKEETIDFEGAATCVIIIAGCAKTAYTPEGGKACC